MEKHCNFAAVAEITQQTIQTVLRIYHSADLIPTQITASQNFPDPLGSNDAKLSYSLFLDVPRVTLAAGQGDRVALDLRLVGDATVTRTGQIGLARRVLLETRLLVRMTVEVRDSALHLGLDPGDAEVAQLTVRALDEAGLPKKFTDFVQSPPALAFLTALLRAALVQVTGRMSPPLMQPLLRQIGVGSLVHISRSVIHVLDGVVAVAIDLSPGTMSFATWGDETAIKSFLVTPYSSSDMAVAANPSLSALFNAVAREQANQRIAEYNQQQNDNIALDDLWIAVEENGFYVGGHATKGPFGASFSFHSRLVIDLGEEHTYTYEDEYGGSYTEVYPGYPSVSLQSYDVSVSEEVPWWVWLGILAGSLIIGPGGPPVAYLAAAATIDSIRGNIANQIGATTGMSQDLVQRMSLPDTQSPMIKVALTHISINPRALHTRSTFTPDWTWSGAGQIAGPQVLCEQDWGSQLNPQNPMRWHLPPTPNLWHPRDPLVRIRWQARRMDNGNFITIKDKLLTSEGSSELVLDVGPKMLASCSEYSISCRVYRPVGDIVEELLDRTMTVKIQDMLDRSHPYVMWKHSPPVPQMEVLPGGQQVLVGYASPHRTSRIHRTALPGRCHNAWRAAGEVTYLDDLPFPLEKLEQKRSQVCDYCFFGGPDKTDPLIPIN